MGERARVGDRVTAWLMVGMVEAVGVGEPVVTAVVKAVGVGIEVASSTLLVAGCLVAVRVLVGGGGKIGSVVVGSGVVVAVGISGVRLMKASSPLDQISVTPTSTRPAPVSNRMTAATADQWRDGFWLIRR